jgi:hypothetical protein
MLYRLIHMTWTEEWNNTFIHIKAECNKSKGISTSSDEAAAVAAPEAGWFSRAKVSLGGLFGGSVSGATGAAAGLAIAQGTESRGRDQQAQLEGLCSQWNETFRKAAEVHDLAQRFRYQRLSDERIRSKRVP